MRGRALRRQRQQAGSRLGRLGDAAAGNVVTTTLIQLGFERIAWRAQARNLATDDPKKREARSGILLERVRNDVPGPVDRDISPAAQYSP